jgi:hypothetical protein
VSGDWQVIRIINRSPELARHILEITTDARRAAQKARLTYP